MATMRNIAISLLRLAGWTNIKRATEKMSRSLGQTLALVGVQPGRAEGGDHNTATLAKALGEVLPVVRRGAAAGRGTRCADTASRRSARAANAKISIAASHGGLPYLLHDATRDRALRLIQLRRRSRGGGVR